MQGNPSKNPNQTISIVLFGKIDDGSRFYGEPFVYPFVTKSLVTKVGIAEVKKKSMAVAQRKGGLMAHGSCLYDRWKHIGLFYC